MSKDALQEVISARAAGYRVIGEAVASGIALTDAGLCVSITITFFSCPSPHARFTSHSPACLAALRQDGCATVLASVMVVFALHMTAPHDDHADGTQILTRPPDSLCRPQSEGLVLQQPSSTPLREVSCRCVFGLYVTCIRRCVDDGECIML